MNAADPVRIASPSALAVQLNAKGSVRRLDHRDVIANAYLGTEVEGGPANLAPPRRPKPTAWVPRGKWLAVSRPSQVQRKLQGTRRRSHQMKSRVPIAAVMLALIAILGCESTKVTDREAYQGRRLARPDRILVHDFAATGADLPEWSEAHDHYVAPSVPRTVAEIATGRELGAHVAAELVADIREMGLPAVRAKGQPAAKLGDIALVGYFESIDEGSAAKRTAIGLGTGAAEMKTQVEGYRMTESGMHRLASAKVQSGPGGVVPLVVTIATVNPIGSIIGGAGRAGGERTGKTAIEDTAKQAADAIAEELRTAFKKQGWI